MKPIYFLLCLMTIITSSMFAQSKGEMPFTSSSPNANKLIRKAWIAMSDAQMEEGNSYVQQALKEDPDCGMAYISISTPDIVQRAENIRLAEGKKLSADERLFIEGIKASTDKKSANEYFNPLLKKYPKDDYLHLVIMFIINDQKRSVEIGENLIKRNPKFAPAYNLLGYNYMNQNEMAKAEASFDKYISLRPDLHNVYDSKADFLMRARKTEEAISLYEKAASMGLAASASKAQEAREGLKFPNVSVDEQSKIKTLIQPSIHAFEGSNESELLKDYSEHAVKIWGNNMVTVGRAGVRQSLINMFKNGSYPRFEGSIQSVNGTGPIAVALGRIDAEWKPAASEEASDRTWNVIYLLRRNAEGNWNILADHFYDADADRSPLSEADRKDIDELVNSWNHALPIGEPLDEMNFENFGATYSPQAIEIFPNLTSNVGMPNLRARWTNFTGARMETNVLRTVGMERLGRRAVVWGIGNQNFYVKDSKELRKFQFPWAMILTKEKDDAWKILVLHWGAD